MDDVTPTIGQTVNVTVTNVNDNPDAINDTKTVAEDSGTTTIDVKMSYIPIGGALGHAVAWLIGVDPKHRMDDDLLRLKTYLETGRAPRDAASKVIGAEPRQQRNGEHPPTH